MAKDIQCDSCQNPATVHLTQILNGKVHKVDLCENCAQKLGVTDPDGFSVADLLTKNLLNEGDEEDGGACEVCGYTKIQFKKSGRFGCSSCYESFSDLLSPMLKSMHRSTDHQGKVPHIALERRQYLDQLTQLENDLRKAVESENYENAAELRDAINALKSKAETHDTTFKDSS